MPYDKTVPLAERLTEQTTSRRDFFRAISRRAKDAAEAENAPRINAGRPIGAIEEALFTRLCNQCGDCVDACPQQILQMGRNGPELDLSLNHCTFCNACPLACETGALQPNGPKDTGWRPVFSYSCNARSLGTCDECADACPQAAITVIANQLPTVSVNCNGCGECKLSCYIGAISLQKYAPV
ncbi:ferredoxin-type protein NapF [Grimontia hollisae]|uniref:Ferredoxin-type protein n=1 Tax=Grimontia hollisae TaxID=673 RepID=A0A377HNI1_GRIHO|nr:ferredoxin-type protein NapF [Grimontia hollisae]STO57563.1 ferredoxin-type protein [Grimontia hollisae]STQ75390.1 ferredoxin-type protein [Grimontia hollisae]